MEEIEFRAWNNKNAMIYSGSNLDVNNQLDLFWATYGITTEYPVMQYIGRKDKNGKKMFADDIVQYKNEDAEYKEYSGIGLIQRDSHSHCVNGFSCRDIKTKYYVRLLCGHDLFSIEVIGNQYENPELLK